MNCSDDINYRGQLLPKTEIITPQPDTELSNVNQKDKHQGANQELGSVKTKQYMTETQRRNQTEQQRLKETTLKPKYSGTEDALKAYGQQSLSKGASQKQSEGTGDMQKDERRRLAVRVTP